MRPRRRRLLRTLHPGRRGSRWELFAFTGGDPNLTTLRAVLFDLDDTVYPEQEYVLSGFRAVSSWAEIHVGIPADRGFAQLHDLFASGVRRNTFNQWLALHDLCEPALVVQLVKLYREHTPSITPFPESREVLKKLREQYQLGLITDGYHDVQARKIAALNLGEYFDAIVLSDALGKDAWKPSPKPFEVALAKLHAERACAVYIGDNPAKDFLGARRAGLRSIRIRRPGCEHANVEPVTPEHAPDYTIATLREIPVALGQIDSLAGSR